jgi:hypothetical protein
MTDLRCEKISFLDAGAAEIACAAWAGRGSATAHVVTYYCPECCGYHWGNAFGWTSKRSKERWAFTKTINKANKKWGVLVGMDDPIAIPAEAIARKA